MKERVPNKFSDLFGPYATGSRNPDEDGFYKIKGCMWLVGFMTCKTRERDSSKGARELREMTEEEVKEYLSKVEVLYGRRWDARIFVESARRIKQTHSSK